MKNLYPFLILLFLSLSIYAQSPEKMSYQAVVRDANNILIANKTIGMQISILQSTITGTVVYSETHSVDTNINGLVSLEIGTGSTSDNFSEIDWSVVGPYFIKTETDPTGGDTYSITGINQLLSVPFALYAKSSGSSETNATNIANNTTSIEKNSIAITLNTAKIGITAQQASDITSNNAKTVITSEQSDAIEANTLKIGYTEAAVSANTGVAANTAKVGYTEAAVSANTAVAANTAKIGSTLTSGITKANHETDALGTQLGFPSSYGPPTNFALVGYTGALRSTVVGLNFPVDQPLASNIDSEVLTQARTVWLQKHVSNGLTEPTIAAGFDPIAELGSIGSNAFSMLQPYRQISALVSFGCDLKFKPSKTSPTEIISRFMYYDPNDPTNTGAGESNYRNWKKIRQCEIKTHIAANEGLGSSGPGPLGSSWGTGFYTETLDHSEYKSVLVNLNPAYFYTVMIQIETFAHEGIVLTRDRNHASTLTIIEVGGNTTGSAGE